MFDRSTTAQEAVRDINLRGRQVVLTGASSGLGAETARALARTGVDLVLAVSDLRAGEALAQELMSHATGLGTTGRIQALALDLSDLTTVLRFADRISGPVDVLIANAGVSKTPDAHLANGLDVRFATNHLGHFLLACRLHQSTAQRGARMVVLSLAAHSAITVRHSNSASASSMRRDASTRWSKPRLKPRRRPVGPPPRPNWQHVAVWYWRIARRHLQWAPLRMPGLASIPVWLMRTRHAGSGITRSS